MLFYLGDDPHQQKRELRSPRKAEDERLFLARTRKRPFRGGRLQRLLTLITASQR